MDLNFYTNFTQNLATQEAQLNTLQTQVSTGLKVQTPDQNPAVFETATLGQDQISALANDSTTQASIQVQLGAVTNAYSEASTLLDNVQTVVEQALNGTTSPQNLAELSTQVKSALQQLQSIANTTAPNGTFLFGGSRGSVAPFQVGASGAVEYLGDGGQSQAAITPDTQASTIANGDVFVAGLSGNGTSSIAAAASNAGTGQLLSTGIVSQAAANAFQQGNLPITLSFAAGATGTTYTATQNGATIGTGTLAVTGSTTLQLAGSAFEITGAPAAGDSFTISPSRPQSAFALLQTIATALGSAGSTPAQVAQTNQVLNNSLAGIAQYQQSVLTGQAQTGVTLQAVSAAGTSNSEQSTTEQISVQNATGVNTPVAITQLDETLTALQAAMKAFGDAQGLSLFQYI
jgi:flagellar hook-associated protein 3 FlgL